MQLNYHHLQYFFATAREGSISRASEVLNVTPQTVSGQVAAFENYLGKPLFDRKGKKLILNSMGKLAYEYAEQIFSSGQELMEILTDSREQPMSHYTIGITDVVPKVLAFDMLHPASKKFSSTRFIYREGDFKSLAGQLALNQLDLIISDHSLMPGSNIKAFSHEIGEMGVSFFATADLAKRYKANFPASLDGAPLLLTGDNSSLKVNLQSWFEQQNIAPHYVAEFDDTALLKLYGQAGEGIFCTPTCIEAHIEQEFGVECIGKTDSVIERLYLISGHKITDDPVLKSIFTEATTLIC